MGVTNGALGANGIHLGYRIAGKALNPCHRYLPWSSELLRFRPLSESNFTEMKFKVSHGTPMLSHSSHLRYLHNQRRCFSSLLKKLHKTTQKARTVPTAEVAVVKVSVSLPHFIPVRLLRK
ncbi:phosphatidylserine decarboxylase proenzyme 1 [Pyrus ussuriensis x Pyrus communis]|uniref:Phosphatidylserine decarboxylase proenzyme 1 n=1 Tax=Pyrus ussuriensis x Pyrus communis TaxID=2448454 RepID=A0A5N5H9B3_9ROSA|nr:phosphatidylserine decarboxylase proenzyme 1 [Pyrus ussuriensis x Pyrus communis]